MRDPATKAIDDLKSQVHRLRHTVLGLSRVRIDWLAHGSGLHRADGYRWQQAVVEEVLANATVLSDPLSVDRAYCPLCGQGADSFTESRGYSFPRGLEQHLIGKGKVTRCPVTEAAFALWHESAEDDVPDVPAMSAAEALRDKMNRMQSPG